MSTGSEMILCLKELRFDLLVFASSSLDAPVFMSHPHFLNADPELLETVDGLHPNEEKHGLFVDLHSVSEPFIH